MADYDFGMVNSDVLALLPVDSSQVDASSGFLTTTVLSGAIDDAANVVIGLASAQQITANAALATSDPETHDILKSAAVIYAAAMVALRHPRLHEVYQRLWQQWATRRNEIVADPETLGSGYAGYSGIDLDLDDVGTSEDAGEVDGWDWEDDEVF